MSQIDKSSQIDAYLDQIDKKSGSSQKKMMFLLLGLILIAVVGLFGYTQFGADGNPTASVSPSEIDGSEASTVIPITVNNDNVNTPDENELPLDGENPDELDPADDNNPIAEAAGANNNNEAANNNESNNADDDDNSGGISERSFTADEVANMPSARTFNEGGSASNENNDSASSSNDKPANTNESPSQPNAEDDKPSQPKAVASNSGNSSEDELTEKSPTQPTASAEKPAATPAAPKPSASSSRGATKNPSFPGGESRMRQYFARKITYPSRALNNGVEGNVNVRVKVNESGKIVDSKVVNGIGMGCDREVLKAINKMPKWEPGLTDGKPTAKYYMISVAFKLPE